MSNAKRKGEQRTRPTSAITGISWASLRVVCEYCGAAAHHIRTKPQRRKQEPLHSFSPVPKVRRLARTSGAAACCNDSATVLELAADRRPDKETETRTTNTRAKTIYESRRARQG